MVSYEKLLSRKKDIKIEKLKNKKIKKLHSLTCTQANLCLEAQ